MLIESLLIPNDGKYQDIESVYKKINDQISDGEIIPFKKGEIVTGYLKEVSLNELGIYATYEIYEEFEDMIRGDLNPVTFPFKNISIGEE